MARDGKDQTTGEVKLVRGSGPPILTVEGRAVEIADRLFALSAHAYHPRPPQPVEVIGIDLTRRCLRLRGADGKEVVYSAEKGGRDGDLFVFSTAGLAKANAVKIADEAVKRGERDTDQALERLQQARDHSAAMRRWTDDDLATEGRPHA